MGGSPGSTTWPQPFGSGLDISGYLTAKRLKAAAPALDAAVDGMRGKRPDLAALATVVGLQLPDELVRYVATWPDDAVAAVVKVVRSAATAGVGLQIGWTSSSGPVQIIAPDAWPHDGRPVPVIVVGPHP